MDPFGSPQGRLSIAIQYAEESEQRSRVESTGRLGRRGDRSTDLAALTPQCRRLGLAG